MQVKLNFHEKKKMSACYDKFEVFSDAKEVNSGEGYFPEPFDYFVISVLMCAGHYVREFCLTRNIEYKQIDLSLNFIKSERGQGQFDFTIKLPFNFPQKYTQALVASVNSCSVKNVIMNAPIFNVSIQD